MTDIISQELIDFIWDYIGAKCRPVPLVSLDLYGSTSATIALMDNDPMMPLLDLSKIQVLKLPATRYTVSDVVGEIEWDTYKRIARLCAATVQELTLSFGISIVT